MIWPDDTSPFPQAVQQRESEPVPMWFVSMEEWLAAADDGFVGWDELRSTPSFREGLADFYHMRQNFNSFTYTLDIRGYLTSADDTQFRVHFVGRFVFHDDGSFSEIIPRFIVEFY